MSKTHDLTILENRNCTNGVVNCPGKRRTFENELLQQGKVSGLLNYLKSFSKTTTITSDRYLDEKRAQTELEKLSCSTSIPRTSSPVQNTKLTAKSATKQLSFISPCSTRSLDEPRNGQSKRP